MLLKSLDITRLGVDRCSTLNHEGGRLPFGTEFFAHDHTTGHHRHQQRAVDITSVDGQIPRMDRITFHLLGGLLSLCVAHVCNAELVAHWKLDEGIGVVVSSVSGDEAQAGTVGGAKWTDEGLAPVPTGTVSALVFDPADHSRVVTNYPGLLDRGAKSVSVWFRADPDQPEAAAIVSWGGDAQGNDRMTLRLNDQANRGTVGAFQLETGTGWKTGAVALDDGQWHHLAIVVDEGRVTTQNARVYIDGTEELSTSAVSELDELVDTDPGSPVTIGASGHGDGFGFLGAIDEVRLYDHALSEAEVASLATSGILSLDANPQAVEPGETSTLRWEVETPFDTVALSPGGIDVTSLTIDGIGTTQVTVTEATIYTLTLKRGERSDIATTRVSVAMPPDVRINEVMSSNERTIDDEDRDDSDWIELKNFGNAPADLEGWYLTDLPDNPDNWRFPVATLAPGETLLVFASGKDRRIAGAELHSDFRLMSDGEYLALIHPDGATVASEFAPALPGLPTDVSYGLAPDGNALRYFVVPTPGADNSPGTAELGPILRNLTENPEPPVPSGDLEITVNADAAQAEVAKVALFYRFMYEDEVEVPMPRDGDAFSAAIPLTGLRPGQMVRWRVVAEDARGVTSMFPPFENTRDSPEYHGTVLQNPIATDLPVLEWFVETASRANRTSGTRCSVFYLGEFYDNVFVRLRGGSSAGLTKKSYKFEFNKGHKFRFMEDAGRADEFNLNTTYTDKTYLRQSLCFEIYDKAGTPGCISFPMRVEQNGEFFSVAAFIEQPDPDLLEREDLDPNGVLYKMGNTFTSTGGAEKKSRKWETSKSDLNSFIRAMRASDEELTVAIFDFVDVPATLNYLAATVITQNNDSMAKNYYLYRDSDGSGQWFPMPWDLDLTLGRHFMTADSILSDIIWADEDVVNGGSGRNVPISPSHPMVGTRELPGNRSWNRLIDKLFANEAFTDLYRRRLRTLMDEILGAPNSDPATRWIDTRIDEMAAMIGNDAVLDLAKWRNFGQRQTLAEAIGILKTEYLDVRRVHLFETHAAANIDAYPEPDAFSAALPPAQEPEPMIRIGMIEGSPPSGNQLEEFIELTNDNDTPVDISGWRLTGAVRHIFAPGSVLPANGRAYVSPDIASFLNRSAEPRGGQGHLVLGNYAGQISTRGEILMLLDASDRQVSQSMFPANPSQAQTSLRITEIHFAPLGGRDGEFIELRNIGESALDLSGVAFTNGITYQFPAGAQLEAGEWIVLAADTATFETIHPEVAVFGEFSGSLDNAGERLTLRDALGENVLDFNYNDAWYPAAEAEGKSFEIINILAEVDRWGVSEAWQISAVPGGSPAAGPSVTSEPITYGKWSASFFSVEELADASVSGIGADANADGVSNALAYAFDFDPKGVDESGNALSVTGEQTLRYQRWSNTPDIAYVLERSGDLINWNALEADSVSSAADNKEVVTATAPSGEETSFVRLRVMVK